ncbi:SPOR domain-containing protein [Inhella proteolytica]|uniref:SPOR domain-containing protein n=1 Tax=Inhella proteolytica TaxID=2795029 RepID=A0A931NID6_9BURK|nr:SPOR domain-containing protein [Inhella proteolytica]MBH9577460.1 SPOR domain-containing protein [Inhella proteolytica]
MSEAKKAPSSKGGAQKGGFGLGLVVGLLLGLAIALGVALYVTKVPIPFVDKTPQRNAELDAAEAAANKNWDPNAGLNGGKSRVAASGVVAAASVPSAPASAAPVPAPTPTPVPQASAVATKPTEPAASKPAGADPYVYFVQAGAFTKPEEAEQQRARLGLQGFNAKVYEREANGRVVYRVRIGPFDMKADADTLHAQVQDAGLEAAVVRAQR